MERHHNRVFISYGHQDANIVGFLAADLRTTSIDIWFDQVEILPGDSLIRKISDGLKDADYVLACLSETSVHSNWVKTELEIAATRGIRQQRVTVLPLLIGSISPTEIPVFLSHLVYTDFRCGGDYDESLVGLVRRVAPQQLVRGVKDVVSPLHSLVLAIDANRADTLVNLSSQGEEQWVIDLLIAATRRKDPSERHWVYWALAQIGGADAEAALEKGRNDPDEFARLGAQA